MPNHTELAFETAIEHSLLTQGGYQKRPPTAFDPVTALFPFDVIDFIRESQPTRWGNSKGC
jgi:type I restriction enzyme R subunit